MTAHAGKGPQLLMISTERKMLEEGSVAAKRMQAYAPLFGQLHVIVLSRKSHKLKAKQLAPNMWVYPTDSYSRLLYAEDALRIAKEQLAFVFGFQADMVTAQDPYETGLIAYFIAKKYRKRLQLQVHGDIFTREFRFESYANYLRYFIAKWLFKKAHCVRVVSPQIKEELERRYPGLRGRVVALPVYNDTSRLEEAPHSTYLHEKYPHFKFVILMVARLTKEKNIPLALETLKRVRERYPQAGLVIVGEGPEERRLKREAERLGVSEGVVFEGWQQDLAPYYKSANLLLLTSNHEGYGNVFVESAAARLPIVTTDVGLAAGLPEGVKQFMVCPVGDAECLASKIMRYINDNTTIGTFMLNVRDHVLALTAQSLESYLESYKRSFEHCLKQGPRGK